MEKSTKLGDRKGSGDVGNSDCVGEGIWVGGMQCWLVPAACVSVLRGGGALFITSKIAP